MSIRKKGNGWEVRVYVGIDPGTGKKKFACKRAKTEREARRLEAGLRRQVETNTYVPPTKQTVAEFLDEWLQKDAKPNTKPRTYERYAELVQVHIKPAIGAVRLDKLTRQHVATLLAAKREQGLSPAICRYIYRTLHRALRVAVEWGQVGRNVCDAVRPPRVEEEMPVGLTSEQAEALLKAAEGSRLYPLLLAAVHTGMRQGELLALRWEDVDLEAGVALVRRSLEKSGRSPKFGTPENGKGRVVPLSLEVVEALRRLRVDQEIERAFFGTAA